MGATKQTYEYISTEIIEFFYLTQHHFITFNIGGVVYSYEFLNSDETNDFMEKICDREEVEMIAGLTIYVKCNMDTDTFVSFANYDNAESELPINYSQLMSRPPILPNQSSTVRERIIEEAVAITKPLLENEPKFEELDLDSTWSGDDFINHPDHYTSGGIECIDYIKAKFNREEFIGFLKGNIIKYLTRATKKGSFKDYEKAQWYLNKLVSDCKPDDDERKVKDGK